MRKKNKRIYLGGQVFEITPMTTNKTLTDMVQQRYDKFIGQGKILVQCNIEQEQHHVQVMFKREYGPSYEDPTGFSDNREFILDHDEYLIIGPCLEQKFIPGFGALVGRAWIHTSLTDFFAEYKRHARNNHCSKVHDLCFMQTDRETIRFEITL